MRPGGNIHKATFRAVAAPVLFCLGTAALLVGAALARNSQLRVPPAVAFIAAAVLLAAALALLAKAARRPKVVDWLMVAILTGFAIVGAWIALAGEAGACRPAVPGQAIGSSAGCRAAFGIGALINAGVAAWAMRLAWRSSHSATTSHD